VKCEHKNCDHQKGVWVTINLNKKAVVSDEGKMKKHSYCEHCGTIEYKGDERARRLGHFSNLLSSLKTFLEKERVAYHVADIKLTDAHLRLIMKELSAIDDFEDNYWRSFESQKEEFIKIVRKYLPKLSVSFISGFFDYRPAKKQTEEELIMQLYGLYEEEDREAREDIYSDDELYENE